MEHDVLPSDEGAAQGLGLPSGRFDDLPGLQPEAPDLLRGTGGEPAAGSGDDEGDGYTSVLARAARLRFPRLRELSPRERVDALVDHICDTAVLRGELEEVRLNAETELFAFRGQWNRIPTVRGSKTQTAAEAAKRDANPELAEQIDTARWLIQRCTEAIARFGGSDYDAASRAYTLIAG